MTESTGYRIAWQVLRAIRSVLLTTTAILGVASIGAVAAGLVLDVRPLVVVSGSMEPTIPVGSLIAGRTVPADEVQVGDVVTVPRRSGTTDLVTHRVVEVRDSAAAPGARELVLRGDANATDDPMPYTVTEVRRHVATVPGGGYLVRTLQSPRGTVVLGGVLLAAVVLTFAVPGEQRTSGAGRTDGRRGRRAAPADGGPGRVRHRARATAGKPATAGGPSTASGPSTAGEPATAPAPTGPEPTEAAPTPAALDGAPCWHPVDAPAPTPPSPREQAPALRGQAGGNTHAGRAAHGRRRRDALADAGPGRRRPG